MLRNRKYLVFSAVVIAFWAVMTAQMLRREVFVPRLPASAMQSAAQAGPRDTWMAVSLAGDQRVGYIHTTSRPEAAEGVPGTATEVLARLRLTLLGNAADVKLTGSAWSAYDGRKARFKFDVDSGAHALSLDGHVGGGFLEANVRTAGETVPLRVPVQQNPLFSGGLGSMLTVPVLEPGDEYVVDTFDPMSLAVTPTRLGYAGEETLQIGRESFPAVKVKVNASGAESMVWVSHEGEVLKAQTPYGFTLERVTAEQAQRDFDAAQRVPVEKDLLSSMAVHPTGKAPFRGAREMHITVSGLDSSVEMPEDPTQSRKGAGKYVIASPDAPSGAVAATAGMAEFLSSDALVQADHPQIVEQARKIVGNETDPWKRALALYDWVYESIEKTSVLSVPSALDVLKTRQGDCNEHTVLYTALARASNIPTRICLGVVWSDELNGFYYHAWPEVYAGRWIWVDPTLGQPVADATHVKLVTGDIAQWARIVPYLGRLQLEITDIR